MGRLMKSWSIRRSRLNHDLIGNRILTGLGALDNITRGRIVASPETVYESLQETWDFVFVESQILIDSFMFEMSPETLFDEPPLCYCFPTTISWLKDYVHSRWLNRCSVHKNLRDLQDALNMANASFNRLKIVFFSPVNNSADLLEFISASRTDVVKFSGCLSKLPNKLLI
ncbi:MAG: hypothetical protein ACYC58_09145 [Pseudomonadaceae bacterium]